MLKNNKNLFAGLLIALAILLPANAMAKFGTGSLKPAPVKTNPAPVVKKQPQYKPAPVKTNPAPSKPVYKPAPVKTKNTGSQNTNSVNKASGYNTKKIKPAPVKTVCKNCNKNGYNTKKIKPAPVKTVCKNCNKNGYNTKKIKPAPVKTKANPVVKVKPTTTKPTPVVEVKPTPTKPTPVVAVKPIPTNPTPASVPEPNKMITTGPTDIIFKIIGLTMLTASASYYISSRKML